MATPLSADKMLAALKKEGVRVSEHSGWRTHNREGHGAWGPVNGIIVHHTAGADSSAGLSLVYNGRSDLPGPLAHAYLSKSGTVTLTGNGRANHAGLGDSNILATVIDEAYTATTALKPRLNNTDGNARFYGIEIANLGNGKDPYPKAQYDAAVKWAAAICRAHGWSEKSVIGHKEWTNQKIDPSFSMTTFRADVRKQLAGTYDKPETTTPPAKSTSGATAVTVLSGQYYYEAYRTSPATLSSLGTWYEVTMTGETSDAGEIFTPGVAAFGGAGAYQGVAWVELSGVPEGDEVQVRLAEKNSSGTTKTLPIAEAIGTGGNTYFAYPFYGLIGTGKTVTLQVLNSTTSASVVLESVRIAGQWWRS